MRIATLSDTGVGTSMMLKLFIDDVLRAEGIEAETVPWDPGNYQRQQADLVVAPANMADQLKELSARVILIDNLVDKKEIKQKILKAIREVRKSQNKQRDDGGEEAV